MHCSLRSSSWALVEDTKRKVRAYNALGVVIAELHCMSVSTADGPVTLLYLIFVSTGHL